MQVKPLLASLTVTLCTLSLLPQSARAGTIHNDWNYGIDSFRDGISRGDLGGVFEMYGLGIKQDGETIYVGLDARLPITGEPRAGTLNETIAWGDLFFNFTGNPLLNAQGSLFGVRFASGNDASVTPLGLYHNVTGRNIASLNNGFASYAAHAQEVISLGGLPALGELTDAEARGYTNNASWNVIGAGQQVIGSVFEALDSAALSALGFDLNAALGGVLPAQSPTYGTTRQTFGFKFTRTEGMVGDFIAHVFAECLNDGIALKGNLAPESDQPKSTPEPLSLLGLIGVGAALGTRSQRKKNATC
jgi:hypothetical protein